MPDDGRAKGRHGAPGDREYMTAAEVAELFRVSPQQVTKLARAGKLPGFQLGATWRFRRDEMQSFGRGTGRS
jgi:excisionase family DNA binding protein